MQKVIFIFLVAFLTSCGSGVSTSEFFGKNIINPKVTLINWDSIRIAPTNGYTINPDSVKKLETLIAGMPETYTVYSNVHIAGIPTVDTIPEKLTEIIPGKDREILV